MPAVQFIIEFKDQASNTATNIARSFKRAQSSSENFARSVTGTTRSISSLDSMLDTLRAKRDIIPAQNITKIRRYNTEIQKLERQIVKLRNTNNNTRLKSLTQDALTSLPGAAIFTNPIAIAGAAVTAIASVGIETEKTKVAFDTLLQSEEKSLKMRQEILKFSAATPYQKEDLEKVAKTMLAFNIDQKDVMKNMRMLGDIAMGDKNRLSQLTLAFSQVNAAGKLTGQDLLQLINAGFNPLQEISKKTGKSLAVLKDEMSKGAISAKMVNDAFDQATSKGGRFFQMTEKISQTAGGKMSTLIDNFRLRLLDLYGVIEPILIPALDLLAVVLRLLGPIFRGVANTVKFFFDLVKSGNPYLIIALSTIAAITLALKANAIAYALLGGFIKIATLATKIWTGAQWLLNIAMDANPIGLIILAIGVLVSLVYAAVNSYNEWGAALLMVMGPIGWIVNMIMLFRDNWDSIVAAFKEGGIIAGIKKIGAVFLDMILYPVQQLLELLSFIPGFEDLAEGLRSFREGLGLANTQTVAERTAEKVANNESKITSEEAEKQVEKVNNKQTATTTATGGKRTTEINISVSKFFENMIFEGGFDENENEIETRFKELLIRTLLAAKSVG